MLKLMLTHVDYFFFLEYLHLYKMNNYTDQPPRKLFGLALIEYKKA
jgi:quinol-cytochrome oxidoreductase complex cytochrome b subunit